MVFFVVERKIVVVDVKLKVIEQVMDEEDIGDKIEIVGILNFKSEE